MRVATHYAVLVICFHAPYKGVIAAYYGKIIGDIQTKLHDFRGKVYAVNEKQVYITEMNYDGLGDEAYFWVGKGSEGPEQTTGQKTVDEEGSSNALKAYTNSRVLLTLPNKTTDYEYIGMFSVTFKLNFGHVNIPAGFELPAPQQVAKSVVGSQHGVQALEVVLPDSATIELKEFDYDGTATDTRFAVGPKKSASADKLTKLLDENGKDTNLAMYSTKTVLLKLPDGQHWSDYEWFTVYSFAVNQSFVDIDIPFHLSNKVPVHNPTSDVHKGGGGDSETFFLIFGVISIVVCVGAGIFFYWYYGLAARPATGRAAAAGGAESAPEEPAAGGGDGENPLRPEGDGAENRRSK